MTKTEAGKSLGERRARWRAIVDQAKESGQRPRQFCQEHGLDLGRFYYWRRVFAMQSAAEDPKAHFALVRHGSSRSDVLGDAGLELHVGRGWRLRIPGGVDEATLRVVLGALSESA